ncbi:biotin synthase BioB [Anaerolentibacter hominis]|uniref:biotin synthase BioB n=1 Tax=Anaerolentibacter hominis TaxID=3079009 RepID=UPI0031B80F0E
MRENSIIEAAEAGLSKEQALSLLEEDTGTLVCAAGEVRSRFCGSHFELCTIINSKSGKCSEDCRYCAQSAHYPSDTECYDMLSAEEVSACAVSNEKAGVERFSIVTSGRTLSDCETDKLCGIVRTLKQNTTLSLCSSNGLLKYNQLKKLYEAGITRYHCNMETSESFFPSICTTHTYQDKKDTIAAAQKAGMSICSGGIIGLGESFEDRIDLAFTLKEIRADSIPLNILNPIPGTPLAGQPSLSEEEIVRTAALFRLILKDKTIRLAGGRTLLADKGRLAVRAGVNAMISGDMLTTAGIRTMEDIHMVKELGFETGRENK